MSWTVLEPYTKLKKGLRIYQIKLSVGFALYTYRDRDPLEKVHDKKLVARVLLFGPYATWFRMLMSSRFSDPRENTYKNFYSLHRFACIEKMP